MMSGSAKSPCGTGSQIRFNQSARSPCSPWWWFFLFFIVIFFDEQSMKTGLGDEALLTDEQDLTAKVVEWIVSFFLQIKSNFADFSSHHLPISEGMQCTVCPCYPRLRVAEKASAPILAHKWHNKSSHSFICHNSTPPAPQSKEIEVW